MMTFNRRSLAIFFAKIELHENGCWVWRAARNSDCYGVFDTVSAHRVSYLWFVGEIPEGWQVDHLCRHRWCVNPAHLEAVTRSVNLLRRNAKANRAAGFCKRGHAWTPENITTWNRGAGRPLVEACATCRRDQASARHKRNKVENRRRA